MITSNFLVLATRLYFYLRYLRYARCIVSVSVEYDNVMIIFLLQCNFNAIVNILIDLMQP